MMMHLTTFSALALALPGTDWLYQFTNNLTALTTANGGALTNLGITLLSTIAFFQLVNMVVNFSTSNMTFSLNPTPLEAGEIVRFLLRLTVCCLLETYWVNPLPGASFGLNHLFSALAQSIVSVLDQNSLSNFTQLLQRRRLEDRIAFAAVCQRTGLLLPRADHSRPCCWHPVRDQRQLIHLLRSDSTVWSSLYPAVHD